MRARHASIPAGRQGARMDRRYVSMLRRGAMKADARHLRHGPDGDPAADLRRRSCGTPCGGWRRGGLAARAARRCSRRSPTALKLIDRGRLKEMNYRLLVGARRARAARAGGRELRRPAGRDQHPARRPRPASPRTRRRGGGWCWRPPPTGSTPPRSPGGSASTTSSPPTPASTRAAGPSRRIDGAQLLRPRPSWT